MKAHKISRLAAQAHRVKMLVTGSHGFIGSAFSTLAAKTFQVIRVSRLEKGALPQADMLVHIAARTAKSQNDASTPEMYQRDNVLGTKQLLRRLTQNPTYFLYVSTMDVMKKPLTPYAQSKLEAEHVVAAYCKKNAIPVGIARLGSVYGPGEGEYGKVIPTFIQAALAGKKRTITHPKVTRRFIYVDDVATTLMDCIHHRVEGIIPIVGSKNISIGNVAKRIDTLIHGSSPHKDSFDKNLAREIEWFRNRQTLYFDMDGTIVSHWKRIYAVYRACCAHFGDRLLSPPAFQKNKQDGRSDVSTKHDTWKRTRIESPALLATDTLVPGMKNVLAKLHKTHKLVLVSARTSQTRLEKQLATLGIRDFFDAVIADEEKVIQDGIVIGDTEAEIQAAKRAGSRCISVSWGIRNEPFLRTHGASEIVQTPQTLVTTIARGR